MVSATIGTIRGGAVDHTASLNVVSAQIYRGVSVTGPRVSYCTGQPITKRPPASVVRQYSTAALIWRWLLARVCSIDSGPVPCTAMLRSGSMP